MWALPKEIVIIMWMCKRWQVYTCKIFNLFENQFLNRLAMVWDPVDCQNTIGVFEVKEENSEKVRIVRFDQFYSPWTMHSQLLSIF